MAVSMAETFRLFQHMGVQAQPFCIMNETVTDSQIACYLVAKMLSYRQPAAEGEAADADPARRPPLYTHAVFLHPRWGWAPPGGCW